LNLFHIDNAAPFSAWSRKTRIETISNRRLSGKGQGFQRLIQENKDWNLPTNQTKPWRLFQRLIQENKDWNRQTTYDFSILGRLSALDPGKQGLKPQFHSLIHLSSLTFSAWSRKTRIETTFLKCFPRFIIAFSAWSRKTRIETREKGNDAGPSFLLSALDPGKQGLKRLFFYSLCPWL